MDLLGNSKYEICKSKFKLHAFFTEVNNDTVMFQVVKMLDSIYLWIGYTKQPNLSDLSIAMSNQFGAIPVATKLLGDSIEETSRNIAIRLCKRLNKAVFVSLNVDEGRFTVPLIEKRIQEEISKHPDYF